MNAIVLYWSICLRPCTIGIIQFWRRPIDIYVQHNISFACDIYNLYYSLVGVGRNRSECSSIIFGADIQWGDGKIRPKTMNARHLLQGRTYGNSSNNTLESVQFVSIIIPRKIPLSCYCTSGLFPPSAHRLSAWHSRDRWKKPSSAKRIISTRGKCLLQIEDYALLFALAALFAPGFFLRIFWVARFDRQCFHNCRPVDTKWCQMRMGGKGHFNRSTCQWLFTMKWQ